MMTDKKLIELLFNAALCYIPNEELSENQRERLDKITYRWCSCRGCKRRGLLEQIIGPEFIGHANKQTLEIYLSRPFLRENIDMPIPSFLLTMIEATLHEIVHILFPDCNEPQTDKKTRNWLMKNEWLKPEIIGKEALKEMRTRAYEAGRLFAEEMKKEG